MKKILLTIFIIIFIGMPCIYSGFWFLYKSQLENEIIEIVENNSYEGVTVSSNSLSTSGFPLLPETKWSGDIYIEKEEIIIEIPSLIIKGFLIANQDISFHLPKGISAGKDKWESKKLLDEIFLGLTVPTKFPKELTKIEIQKWKDDGGIFPIRDSFIMLEEIKMSGHGNFYLDDNLQIAGKLDIEIENADNFIKIMKDSGQINPTGVMLAKTFIDGMSVTDKETNKKSIKTELKINNRDVYIGMFKVGTNEMLYWK